MSKTDHPEDTTNANVRDRLGPTVPSVDRPWDSFQEVFRRLSVRQGDRATHRAYHSLYEDMLN